MEPARIERENWKVRTVIIYGRKENENYRPDDMSIDNNGINQHIEGKPRIELGPVTDFHAGR